MMEDVWVDLTFSKSDKMDICYRLAALYARCRQISGHITHREAVPFNNRYMTTEIS